MSVLQHYRTSFQDTKRGHAGFGTKAASLGVTSEMEAQLLKLSAYVIPRDLDERNIATHPIALRYMYLSPTQSILLSSQSCGSDELGRAGNYFAHSLILPPNEFLESNTPPIFYWRSTFWKTHDPSDETVLPTLPTFDVEPSFDVDRVSSFLAEGQRASQFYKLLSAVISSSQTSRRIVLLDSAEHVALWVAALSVALPPYYRPLLSFATYHHDPYQTPFLVTGTTATSAFRFSPDEYVTYFIINTETGAISNVEDSRYARRVTDLLLQDLSHDELLTIFETATRRFPRPIQMSAQLEQVVDYMEVLSPSRQTPLTPTQLESVHLPRQTFEELTHYDDEDREELQRLTATLGDEVKVQPVPAVVTEYVETLRTFSKRDQRAIDRLPDDLLIATNLLMERDQAKVLQGGDLVRKLRGEVFKDRPQEFRQKLNGPDYLPRLAQMVQSANISQLRPIWHYIGRYLDAGKQSKGILVASLRTATQTKNGPLSLEQCEFLEHMQGAMRGRETAWLQLAADSRASLPEDALERFYYIAILGGLSADGKLSLDQRVPFRQVMETLQPDIAMMELREDLAQALQAEEKNAVLSALEDWDNHLRRQQMDVGAWLTHALQELHEQSPQSLLALAPKVLLSSSLKRDLPDAWKQYLLKVVFKDLTFKKVTEKHVQICREYKLPASRLSDQTELLVMGVLAMSEQTLNNDQASRLRRRFTRMSQMEYQDELEAFAPNFFAGKVTGESHGQMVVATYRWEYRDAFWQCYWAQFKGMLVDPQNADLIVSILAFWFDRSLDEFDSQTFSYVIQGFFLGLPEVVTEMRKEHGFRQAAERINSRAAKQEWYPLIQNIFAVERKGFFGIFNR